MSSQGRVYEKIMQPAVINVSLYMCMSMFKLCVLCVVLGEEIKLKRKKPFFKVPLKRDYVRF
jgi:hypothetical protein